MDRLGWLAGWLAVACSGFVYWLAGSLVAHSQRFTATLRLIAAHWFSFAHSPLERLGNNRPAAVLKSPVASPTLRCIVLHVSVVIGFMSSCRRLVKFDDDDDMHSLNHWNTLLLRAREKEGQMSSVVVWGV